MRMRKTGVLTGIMVACVCMTQTAPVFGAQQDLVGFVPNKENQTETQVKSYLTGENVPESIGRRRPVAVMMGNNSSGAPQSGIGHAGVVYEAPVEGNITRLMGILEDYDDLERIGSVRSCRDYYLFYANEFNAIYAHYGQAAYALPYLDQHVIDNLNGIKMGNLAFFRTTDRKPPHNAYTDAAHLQAGIEAMKYRQEYKEDYTGHYLFAEDGAEIVPADGITANLVKLDNFTDNHPWYEYDEASGEYKRFQCGKEHVDQLDDKQLTCDNIILQYSSCPAYDANGYLNIDAISGGEGRFITKGKAIDIRWEKDSPWGITHYYDKNEQEICLNQGTTWVEIVQNDRIDSITYQ